MIERERPTAGQERPPQEERNAVPCSLRGKTLLVTGSARALVLELAEEAGRRGARVALAAPPAAAKEQAVCDCGSILMLPVVPTDPRGCDILLETVLERFSSLDAAIATIPVPPLPALDTLSLEEWQQRAISPVKRVFWLARRIVWEFLAAGSGGKLVFVTEPAPDISATSFPGEPNEIVGSALIPLARSIAKEVGTRSVTCNVVLARAGAGSAGTEAPSRERYSPIVESALFLASEDSSFVNGEALSVRL